MTIADAALAFSNSDFTLEFWLRRNVEPALFGLFSQWGGGGSRSQRFQYDPASNQFQYIASSDGTATSWSANYDFDTDGAMSVATFFNGTFRHVALVRNSGVFTVYVEGVGGATTGSPGSTAISSAPTHAYTLGARHSTDTVPRNQFDGNLDEVRLTIGVARYTANFTPPSSAFPQNSGGDAKWSSVKLLLDFE